MQEYLDSNYVAAKISLLRDAYRGVVLIVEGEDDSRYFQRVIARDDSCRIEVAFGKANALEVLAILRKRKLPENLLVVLDADFWRVTGEEPEDEDVVLTEFHDLEMDMIASQAFDDIVTEISTQELIENFENECGSTIREFVVSQAFGIGKFRFLNEKNDLYINFGGVELTKFVDERSFELSVFEFLACALDASAVKCDSSVLRAEAETPAIKNANPFQVARGHDCVSIISLIFRERLAAGVRANCDESSVMSYLRLAYTPAYFERGQLSEAIGRWENKHRTIVLDSTV